MKKAVYLLEKGRVRCTLACPLREATIVPIARHVEQLSDSHTPPGLVPLGSLQWPPNVLWSGRKLRSSRMIAGSRAKVRSGDVLFE